MSSSELSLVFDFSHSRLDRLPCFRCLLSEVFIFSLHTDRDMSVYIAVLPQPSETVYSNTRVNFTNNTHVAPEIFTIRAKMTRGGT
jgi:hypothetical protein